MSKKEIDSENIISTRMTLTLCSNCKLTYLVIFCVKYLGWPGRRLGGERFVNDIGQALGRVKVENRRYTRALCQRPVSLSPLTNSQSTSHNMDRTPMNGFRDLALYISNFYSLGQFYSVILVLVCILVSNHDIDD
jgi:hypothetical protein